jgi:hypothetical protein
VQDPADLNMFRSEFNFAVASMWWARTAELSAPQKTHACWLRSWLIQ